ncbi:Cytidylate kinase [Geodia barretti]|uniref:(d)CMP kinase n=2 Tax=Geodia barretti TaxID=519541 RepID=A0AA35SPR3_GEOBA|nr:Cytidylate kinase [Geodia barretti]
MKADYECTLTLAIDGPAASGKSVVGREVARRLGIRFLDTGAMYRAITLASIQQGVAADDACKLSSLAACADMRLVTHSNGDRLAEVDASVSAVSAVSGVRTALVAQQRAIASDGSIVMCGRDIGTVVLPDASVKVFLTASAEVRAARRAAEMQQRQETFDTRQVLAALQRRDKIDRERDDSPLRPAADALVICSDHLTIEEVVCQILAEVSQC